MLHKLELIGPEAAFATPVPGVHSVAQLTAHILIWRHALAERLKGNSDFKVEIDSETDWQPQPTLQAKGWDTILSELAENQRELIALLSAETDELLARTFDGKHTFRSLLEGIIQHDIYHTGQIGLVISLMKEEKLLQKV
ncbi:MAG TPA: DinB family protein [Saprospiraceae bacterium]|nr:DinB family protein [Saprospiraceae bacterium]